MRFTQPVRLGDNLDQLRGKQITFGFQVKSTVAGTVRCVANGTILGVVTGAYNVGIAEETIQLTVAIPANETGLSLGVQFDVATATVEVNDGRHALGAVLPNYAPLPAADDLARCLRYYQRITGSELAAFGHMTAATTATLGLRFLQQMGGIPTVTFSAATDFQVRNGAAATVLSAISAANISAIACTILATTAGGLTVGQGTELAGATANDAISLEWNPA